MQTNRCQPSFKAGYVYPSAEKAMKFRMPERKVDILKRAFERKYKNSDFDVFLGTTSFDGNILEATIQHKGVFARYEAETVIDSIFNSPINFVKKVYSIVENELEPRIK